MFLTMKEQFNQHERGRAGGDEWRKFLDCITYASPCGQCTWLRSGCKFLSASEVVVAQRQLFSEPLLCCQICPVCMPSSGQSGTWTMVSVPFSTFLRCCSEPDPCVNSLGTSPGIYKQLTKSPSQTSPSPWSPLYFPCPSVHTAPLPSMLSEDTYIHVFSKNQRAIIRGGECLHLGTIILRTYRVFKDTLALAR